MTLLTTDSKIVYNGLIGQDVFAYNFRVDEKEDMEVYLGGIIIADSLWTIDGLGNPVGGNVTLNDPLTIDQTVTLLRNVSETQGVDYQPFDAFPADTHEQALDYLTMQVQQLQELINRNPVPPPDSAPGDTLVEGNLTVNGSSSLIGPVTCSSSISGITPTAASHLTRKDYVDALLPSGTRVVFQQSTPPVGWTKDGSVNDRALRVVSGAVGSGGGDPFSTVFGAGKSAGGHAISIGEMPSHDHAILDADMAPGFVFSPDGLSVFPIHQTTNSGRTQFTGSGNSHNHSLVMDLQYLDVTVGVKD